MTNVLEYEDVAQAVEKGEEKNKFQFNSKIAIDLTPKKEKRSNTKTHEKAVGGVPEKPVKRNAQVTPSEDKSRLTLATPENQAFFSTKRESITPCHEGLDKIFSRPARAHASVRNKRSPDKTVHMDRGFYRGALPQTSVFSASSPNWKVSAQGSIPNTSVLSRSPLKQKFYAQGAIPNILVQSPRAAEHKGLAAVNQHPVERKGSAVVSQRSVVHKGSAVLRQNAALHKRSPVPSQRAVERKGLADLRQYVAELKGSAVLSQRAAEHKGSPPGSIPHASILGQGTASTISRNKEENTCSEPVKVRAPVLSNRAKFRSSPRKKTAPVLSNLAKAKNTPKKKVDSALSNVAKVRSPPKKEAAPVLIKNTKVKSPPKKDAAPVLSNIAKVRSPAKKKAMILGEATSSQANAPVLNERASDTSPQKKETKIHRDKVSSQTPVVIPGSVPNPPKMEDKNEEPDTTLKSTSNETEQFYMVEPGEHLWTTEDESQPPPATEGAVPGEKMDRSALVLQEKNTTKQCGKTQKVERIRQSNCVVEIVTDSRLVKKITEVNKEKSPLKKINEIPDKPSPLKIAKIPGKKSTSKITEIPDKKSPSKIANTTIRKSPLKITEIPNKKTPLKITKIPGKRSSLKITEIPDKKSPLKITEIPVVKSPLKITEIPEKKSPVKITEIPEEKFPVKATPQEQGEVEVNVIVKTEETPKAVARLKIDETLKTLDPVKTSEAVKALDPVKALHQAKDFNTVKASEPVKAQDPLKAPEPVKPEDPLKDEKPYKVLDLVPTDLVKGQEPVKALNPEPADESKAEEPVKALNSKAADPVKAEEPVKALDSKAGDPMNAESTAKKKEDPSSDNEETESEESSYDSQAEWSSDSEDINEADVKSVISQTQLDKLKKEHAAITKMYESKPRIKPEPKPEDLGFAKKNFDHLPPHYSIGKKHGQIESCIGNTVIVLTVKDEVENALEVGSIFCFEDRTIVGEVFDLFGTVTEPCYCIAIHPERIGEIKKRLVKGTAVFPLVEAAKWVIPNSLNQTGIDVNEDDDNVIPDFSDDEKEIAFMKKRRWEQRQKQRAVKQSVVNAQLLENIHAAVKSGLDMTKEDPLEDEKKKKKKNEQQLQPDQYSRLIAHQNQKGRPPKRQNPFQNRGKLAKYPRNGPRQQRGWAMPRPEQVQTDRNRQHQSQRSQHDQLRKPHMANNGQPNLKSGINQGQQRPGIQGQNNGPRNWSGTNVNESFSLNRGRGMGRGFPSNRGRPVSAGTPGWGGQRGGHQGRGTHRLPPRHNQTQQMNVRHQNGQQSIPNMRQGSQSNMRGRQNYQQPPLTNRVGDRSNNQQPAGQNIQQYPIPQQPFQQIKIEGDQVPLNNIPMLNNTQQPYKPVKIEQDLVSATANNNTFHNQPMQGGNQQHFPMRNVPTMQNPSHITNYGNQNQSGNFRQNQGQFNPPATGFNQNLQGNGQNNFQRTPSTFPRSSPNNFDSNRRPPQHDMQQNANGYYSNFNRTQPQNNFQQNSQLFQQPTPSDFDSNVNRGLSQNKFKQNPSRFQENTPSNFNSNVHSGQKQNLRQSTPFQQNSQNDFSNRTRQNDFQHNPPSFQRPIASDFGNGSKWNNQLNPQPFKNPRGEFHRNPPKHQQTVPNSFQSNKRPQRSDDVVKQRAQKRKRVPAALAF